MSIRSSAPTSRKGTGSLREPKGEAKALANSDPSGRGVASGVRVEKVNGADPIIERMLLAVAKRAEELGVKLEGKLWVKPCRGSTGSCEVHAGRPKLGTLTHDEIVRCEVDRLFELHRAVWLDVVAIPEGMKWPEWSSPLFALRWALGRLMDSALDDLRLHWHKFTPDDDGKCTECRKGEDAHVDIRTQAYRSMTLKPRHESLRAEAAQRYAKGKQATWKARSEFTLASGTASAAADVVVTAFGRWREGEIGYPSWAGPNGSIPIRARELGLTQADDDGFRCRFNVLGKDGWAHECIVRPKGGSAQSQARKIASGEYKMGSARLVWDDRKNRWRISLSYTKPMQPPKPIEPRALAVRRSVTNMLFVMDTAGTLHDMRGMGLKILNVKAQYTRLKSERRSILNFQGKGARGHGKKRFYRPYYQLLDKEARCVDSLLKQLASHIRRAATSSDAQVQVVLLEDFSGRWEPTGGDPRFVRLLKRMPWATVETLLEHELQEHSIRLQRVPSTYDTSCPACGKETSTLEDHYLSCSNEVCGLIVDRQIAAAWRMFTAAGIAIDSELRIKVAHAMAALRRRQNEKAKRLLTEAGVSESASASAAE